MLLDTVRAAGLSTSLVVGSAHTSAQVGNTAGGGLTTLATFTLPQGVFGINEDFVEFEYYGEFAGAAGCELFLFLGTSALFDSGVITPGNDGWSLRGRVIRTSSSAQKSFAHFSTLAAGLSGTQIVSPNLASVSAIAIALKATGVSLNDVRVEGSYLTFYSAAN